mgnify:CR=1 FL=1|jgi:hypothetical protein
MANRVTNGLLNAALVVLGLAVMILLYALVTRSIGTRTDPVRAENPANLVGKIIQVEVRNGCGVDHLAAQTTQFLRDRGFDVVEVGDHTSFDQQESVVIDRVGDLESARRVAAALDIPEDRVIQEIRSDYYLDASVIIGHDYKTLEPFD